jgi:hypothetical protein
MEEPMSMITRADVAGAALRWLISRQCKSPTWAPAVWQKRASCWLSAAPRRTAEQTRRDAQRR